MPLAGSCGKDARWGKISPDTLPARPHSSTRAPRYSAPPWSAAHRPNGESFSVNVCFDIASFRRSRLTAIISENEPSVTTRRCPGGEFDSEPR
jgi:hypothetical protein